MILRQGQTFDGQRYKVHVCPPGHVCQYCNSEATEVYVVEPERNTLRSLEFDFSPLESDSVLILPRIGAFTRDAIPVVVLTAETEITSVFIAVSTQSTRLET